MSYQQSPKKRGGRGNGEGPLSGEKKPGNGQDRGPDETAGPSLRHGRCWTRTSDPIDVSDVLYQLS